VLVIFLHGVMTRALLECFVWALLLVMPEQCVHRATPSPLSQKRVLHQVSCDDGGELGFLDTYTSVGQFSNCHPVLDIVTCENWIENRSLVLTWTRIGHENQFPRFFFWFMFLRSGQVL
jgi:hypothetical protein